MTIKTKKTTGPGELLYEPADDGRGKRLYELGLQLLGSESHVLDLVKRGDRETYEEDLPLMLYAKRATLAEIILLLDLEDLDKVTEVVAPLCAEARGVVREELAKQAGTKIQGILP